MDIKKVLQSRETMRFHNHAGIDCQPISDHQWGVAVILMHIHPNPSRNLLFAGLTHDVAEYMTGDIPAPVKWKNPQVKKMFDELEAEANDYFGIRVHLNEEERLYLKIADVMDGMWYCIQQLKAGRQSARRPFRLWASKLRDLVELRDDMSPNVAAMRAMLMSEKEKWDVSK